jgi:hypothetical protein
MKAMWMVVLSVRISGVTCTEIATRSSRTKSRTLRVHFISLLMLAVLPSTPVLEYLSLLEQS